MVEVTVSCPLGGNLQGRSVSLITHEASMTREVVQRENGTTGTEPFAIQLGDQIGDFVWVIECAGDESTAAVPLDGYVRVPVSVGLHHTSMAVWDVASPVAMGRTFMATVGVQCSGNCNLGGLPIEIRNEAGTLMGLGRLDDVPLPGTALYCSKIELPAPTADGVSSFVATFAPSSADGSHSGACAGFTVRVDQPAAHRVQVRVIEKETRLPVDDVEVRLGHYTTFTDHNGESSIELPTGAHELTLRKDGYKAPPRIVDVRDNVVMEVEAFIAPTRVEREANITKMFEDYPWG